MLGLYSIASTAVNYTPIFNTAKLYKCRQNITGKIDPAFYPVKAARQQVWPDKEWTNLRQFLPSKIVFLTFKLLF